MLDDSQTATHFDRRIEDEIRDALAECRTYLRGPVELPLAGRRAGPRRMVRDPGPKVVTS